MEHWNPSVHWLTRFFPFLFQEQKIMCDFCWDCSIYCQLSHETITSSSRRSMLHIVFWGVLHVIRYWNSFKTFNHILRLPDLWLLLVLSAAETQWKSSPIMICKFKFECSWRFLPEYTSWGIINYLGISEIRRRFAGLTFYKISYHKGIRIVKPGAARNSLLIWSLCQQ